jgi:hypothetical protein
LHGPVRFCGGKAGVCDGLAGDRGEGERGNMGDMGTMGDVGDMGDIEAMGR